MSGGNCPETPRQKMISMMYLFLTAMLAVNVSSSVLEGFTLVDESLRTNNQIFINNNNATYAKFRSEYEKNNTKVKPWLDKALAVKVKADALYNEIDSFKLVLAIATDGEFGNPDSLITKGDIDVSSEIMTPELAVGGKKETNADILKKHINEYREFLIETAIVNPEKDKQLAEAIRLSLQTDPEKKKRGKDAKAHEEEHPEEEVHDKHARTNWEQRMFKEIPIGAVISLMTKIQTDVRNTEALSISHLLSQVDAKDFKVNKIKAYLIPEATSVVRGSVFRAQALLAATDSTNKPGYELFLDGRPIKEINEDGEYEIPCNKVGLYKLTGNIITKDDEGKPNYMAFDALNFEVSEPNATVSATKMNVLYAGVDNPMSISVPGFSSRSLKVSFDDGSPLTPDGNFYIAKPKTADKVINVVVQAEIEGKYELIGKSPFRVKRLPNPTAYIQYPKVVKNASGKNVTIKEKHNTGRLKKKELLNADGIIAELPDSDFEVTYKVLSFDITFYDTMGNATTFSSTGRKFTRDQTNRIKKLGAGTQFFISNVRVLGPDGTQKRLPPIDITMS